ncbi:MAG: class I SAM-dependent methyltransferase [Verrucomicrobiales bacterium]|nr:class I SAM-dependent methyltransferase [Verrucomicrobiales bacterium]
MNFPAISDPNVMAAFPDARLAERDALLELVELHRDQRVLDVQAAGGFLSDEVYLRLGGEVECVCVEPCEELGLRLNSKFKWLKEDVEYFPSVQGGSIDVVLGLAGLHHSDSHFDTIKSSYRVLKMGGELAVCDVEQDSSLAAWLNDFVDRHNPVGHEGRFLKFGQTGDFLDRAGFTAIREFRKNVPWRFKDKHCAAVFFKGLFGLDLDLEQVLLAIDEHFDVKEVEHEVFIDWRLIYCYGRRDAV